MILYEHNLSFWVSENIHIEIINRLFPKKTLPGCLLSKGIEEGIWTEEFWQV